MKTTITKEGNSYLAELDGELDTAAANQASQDLKELFEIKDGNITIDCKKLQYISSSGLRILLSLLKTAKSNHTDLKLTNLNENIKKVFSMTGFSSLFNIV